MENISCSRNFIHQQELSSCNRKFLFVTGILFDFFFLWQELDPAIDYTLHTTGNISCDRYSSPGTFIIQIKFPSYICLFFNRKFLSVTGMVGSFLMHHESFTTTTTTGIFSCQRELYSFLFQEYFHTERLSVCNRKLLLLMVLYPVIFWISSKIFVPFPVILKSICHKLKMRHLRADFGVNFLWALPYFLREIPVLPRGK